MIEVQGLKEFEKMMKSLPMKMRRRKILQIIRSVAGPVEKAAKQEAAMIESNAWVNHKRMNSGNLEASIGRIAGKSKDYVNIMVAPRAKGRYQGFHAHLVQFGTASRANKKGSNRGVMPANNFMGRAFDKTLNNVRSDFERQIAKQVEKYANGLN